MLCVWKLSGRSDNQTPWKSWSIFYGNFGKVTAGNKSNLPSNELSECHKITPNYVANETPYGCKVKTSVEHFVLKSNLSDNGVYNLWQSTPKIQQLILVYVAL